VKTTNNLRVVKVRMNKMTNDSKLLKPRETFGQVEVINYSLLKRKMRLLKLRNLQRQTFLIILLTPMIITATTKITKKKFKMLKKT
jgi:hypothetical protein